MPSIVSSSTPDSNLADFAAARARRTQPLPGLERGARAAADGRLTVLILEPDPLVGEMLGASVRLHRADLEIVLTTEPAQALQVAEQRELQLVLSEIALPSLLAGRALLAELRRRLPLTPLLVLTTPSSEALATVLELEVAVLTKPLDVDHLLRRVDALLARRHDSVVQGIGLESLLQLLELERKTCRLRVSSRRAEGELWLVGGRLVHGEAEDAVGPAALFAMLRWEQPLLRIDEAPAMPPEPAKRTIDRDLQSLLLSFFVDEDHRRRDLERGEA
jgi:DNA-binding response OmpR family regulator